MPGSLRISPLNIRRKSSRWTGSFYPIRRRGNKKLLMNLPKLKNVTCNSGRKRLELSIYNKLKM